MMQPVVEKTMSIEQARAAARRALRALGRSANEVARRLRASGMRGRRFAPRECIMARYLNRRLRGWIAHVGRMELSLFPVGREGDSTAEQLVPLPPAIATFIRRFDRERYPELVSEEDGVARGKTMTGGREKTCTP
jgi:hypothetical protein